MPAASLHIEPTVQDWVGRNDPPWASVSVRTVNRAGGLGVTMSRPGLRLPRSSLKDADGSASIRSHRQAIRRRGSQGAASERRWRQLRSMPSVGLRRQVVGQEVCPGGCAEGQLCTERGCMTPCANHRDCRSKHDDPCVSNTCVDGVCTTAIIECLPGSECCRGRVLRHVMRARRRLHGVRPLPVGPMWCRRSLRVHRARPLRHLCQ